MQWTLSSSDVVRSIIAKSYRNRHEDDLNIPLSVQPWGSDGDKRRYFLIEGNDDTSFRVYRESNPAGLNRTWWSVAGNIDELKALIDKLENQDGGPKAKMLAKKIANSIPRFEATEEKRRRREYRQMRKEQFRRPEPGFSLYEGRTRGKRIKYTYSDDEADFFSDSTNRRSTRNTRNHTPAEPSGPVTTASGRQVRAPTRLNAENASNGAPSASVSVQGDGDVPEGRHTRSGRPQRSAAINHGMNGWATRKRKSEEYESDEFEEEGSEPDFGDDEEDEHVPEETEEDDEEFEQEDLTDEDLEAVQKQSLIFKFPVRVSFDEKNRVRRIPDPPVAAEQDKRHGATHENVGISDGPGANDVGPVEPIVLEAEPPAAEVISVATKTATVPTPGGEQTETDTSKPPDTGADQSEAGETTKSPPNPATENTTSLTLRGSPELARAVPRAVGATPVE